MFSRDLEEHDYAILESYWLRFEEISKIDDPRKLRNAKIIVEGIEKVYNESTGALRDFIEIRYFGNAKTLEEALFDAEAEGISKKLFGRIREKVLTSTAKEISWLI